MLLMKEGISLQYLLDTVETIPAGIGFSHFSVFHLAWLGAFILFTLGCCLLYRRLGSAGRKRMRFFIAAVIVADELFKMAVLIIGSRYTPDYLPLHLCSINIFVICFHALRPGRLTDNFLYTICIPGALAALLFPTWTSLPPANLMLIHSFTVHILLAAYPIMLVCGGDIRPDIRYLPKCLLLLAGLAMVALAVNLTLGTNFMFLMSASEGNPLHWFQRVFDSHLVGFPVLIAGVVIVMYAPVQLLRRRKAKNT